MRLVSTTQAQRLVRARVFHKRYRDGLLMEVANVHRWGARCVRLTLTDGRQIVVDKSDKLLAMSAAEAKRYDRQQKEAWLARIAEYVEGQP